ncbi:hypothetical protein [Serratia proteamaculans]|uniref:hypothetical protein n=1 Tax=Serratia proteamaculans TaxID=28151 RepID=UPI00111BE68A|nr:hypothetical protein [Serratia proteamaculans]
MKKIICIAIISFLFSMPALAESFTCKHSIFKAEHEEEKYYSNSAQFNITPSMLTVKMGGQSFSFPPLKEVNDTMKATQSGRTVVSMNLSSEVRFKVLDLDTGDLTTFINCN